MPGPFIVAVPRIATMTATTCTRMVLGVKQLTPMGKRLGVVPRITLVATDSETRRAAEERPVTPAADAELAIRVLVKHLGDAVLPDHRHDLQKLNAQRPTIHGAACTSAGYPASSSQNTMGDSFPGIVSIYACFVCSSLSVSSAILRPSDAYSSTRRRLPLGDSWGNG